MFCKDPPGAQCQWLGVRSGRHVPPLLCSVSRYARLRTKTTVPSETQHGMGEENLASKRIDRVPRWFHAFISIHICVAGFAQNELMDNGTSITKAIPNLRLVNKSEKGFQNAQNTGLFRYLELFSFKQLP